MKTIITIFIFLALGCASTDKSNLKSVPQKGFDAELTSYAYPYEVRFHAIASQKQKLKMAYMDISPENADIKATYVLFHGKNFSGFYFTELIEFFKANSIRVIVVDQIGFGKSSKPQNYQYSFQELAHNTHELLTALNISKYVVLGHSMGGMLAVRYALMFPNEVKGLALINPIGLEDWKTMTSSKPVNELYKTELANTLDKARDYQKSAYYDGQWSEKYEQLLTPLKGWLEGPDRDVLAWNAALTSDMVFNQPIIYEVKNLKMPTVLIVGTRDRTAIGKAWAPAEFKEKMGRYDQLGKSFKKLNSKQVRLIEIEGLGHVPFIENPQLFWKLSAQPLLQISR